VKAESRSELGEFLRSRRAKIQPEDVGLRTVGRRRVPGLRRDELAQLAGVSVEYYVRLEQGRGPNVSDAVLDALAGVLRLTETERDHLSSLARPKKAPARANGSSQLRPGLRLLLDAMESTPAFVLGRRMDVLAWNRLADAISGWTVGPGGRPNTARHLFLDPSARDYYPDWERVAEETVAYLRLDAGRHPRDPKLAALVGELSIADETFRRLWAAHEVKEKTFGHKLINHPLVGELELSYETLALPGDPDQLLVTYLAEPGSTTAERLALLASWTAEPPAETMPISETDQIS
jgi:transcriptional regulator with XRE-family HTH domain